MPPREAVLPRGVTEEDILPKRYETFASHNDWVQHMRCSLLGLEAGTTPSRKDIDTSDCIVPQVVLSESDLPEVITDHWLPILREEGLLVECPWTSSLLQQTGSLYTLMKVCRNIFR